MARASTLQTLTYARELPPEVWLRVFAYATYIPGAFENDDSQALVAFARDKYGISVHRRHREATDLMLAASRVCKTWTPLITEFLFQYLLVQSGDHAIEVAKVLGRYDQDALNRNAAGRWTVRLELALEGVHWWEDVHTAALARIFEYCPNVTVFSTAFSTTDASLFQGRRFLRAMRDVGMRSNLRRLELKGDAALFETILPPLAPSLETLWLLPSRRTAPDRVLDPMHFPHVHTFILSEGFGWGSPPPNWAMPSLRTLYAEDDNLSPVAQRKAQSFFGAHGAQLEQIVTGRSALNHIRSCTNLVEWTLPCGLLFQVTRLGPPEHWLPTTVRRLTLADDMSTTYMFRLDHIALLVEWLGAGFFPTLETIRFLLPLGRHIRKQRCREDWEQAIELLCDRTRERGIYLEASLGGDEHTADIWSPLTLDHLLDPIDCGPPKHSISAH
ncbi:hypothetical protein GY45DRAFT_265798 [Cubamyces sp. BRFM 1775]|nr:hypothetical protein GY45DRAFT_265798 [Cubamyces sp. BRFM 1775]